MRFKRESPTRFHGNIVFLVYGNPETMEVIKYRIFWRGVQGPSINATLDEVKERIGKWAKWIKTN